MKRRFPLTILLLTLVLTASLATAALASHNRNFVATMSTAEEVPVPTGFDTNPQGVAHFQLSKDGTELHYRLIVANIENVTMAHIHQGAPGVAGPVVAWLYPAPPPAVPGPALIEGRFSGVLATGTITEDVLVGPLEDGTLNDLIAMIEAGNAYVNVHTMQNPPGEIRGQIDARGR